MPDADNNYWVQVLGFNETERLLLSSIFGLAARRDPGFLQRDFNSTQPADLYLVDGDDDAVMAEFRATQRRCPAPAVLVGGSDRGTGLKVVARPIQWARLLQAFDDSVLNEAPVEFANASVSHAPQVNYEKTILLQRTNATTRQAPAGAPIGASVAGRPAAQSAPSRVPFSASATGRPAAQPVARPTPPASVPASRPAARPAALPRRATDTVLVVDDNATVRNFMEATLAPFGFSADFAETGEQAIGLTGTKDYTCVFLDVVLPGIDGYQVCKAIKSNKNAIKRTAVVMLTSRSSSIDKIRGSLAGCDEYLTKPVDESQLLEVIAKFLPSARAAGVK